MGCMFETALRTVLARGMVSFVLLCGCRSLETLRRDCSRGELEACEKACKKGESGDAGCFRAGQVLHRQSGLDDSSTAWTRARSYFDKACSGGFAEGCLFAAQMIEAPFGVASSQYVSDAALAERQALLQKACDAKLPAACKRLGDVLIGKHAGQATSAYEAACQLEPHADECVKARSREVQAFAEYESRCKRGLPDDCARLGYLVYRIDVPRAARIFQAEYALRGLQRLLSEQKFVSDQIAAAKTARVPVPGAGRGREEPAPDARLVELAGVTVEGRLARAPAERKLRENQAAFAACAAAEAPGSSVSVDMAVDRTGDVWRTVASGDWSPAAIRCLRDVANAIRFLPPLGDVARVRVGLSRAAQPEATDSPGTER